MTIGGNANHLLKYAFLGRACYYTEKTMLFPLLTLFTPLLAADLQWESWIATHTSAKQLNVQVRVKRDLSSEHSTKGIMARKCCDIDQVFHFEDNQLSCQILQPSASVTTFKEITQTLWFKKRNISLTVYTGFTKCDPSRSIRLQPELIPSDKFYLSQDGELILPHRFWKFAPDDFCMEDFAEDTDPRKYLRSAFVCIDAKQKFPDNAIDNQGKFRLHHSDDPFLLHNRTVVRKCCDFTSAYSVARSQCWPHRLASTNVFMNTLVQNESLLIRVGHLDCVDTMEPTPAAYDTSELPFHILPNGKLSLFHRTRQIDINTDNYCLENFIYDIDSTSISTVQAWYCPPPRRHKPVAQDGNQTSLMSIPKCCTDSEIMENGICQPLPSSLSDWDVEDFFLSLLDNTLLQDPIRLDDGPWVPTCKLPEFVALSSWSPTVIQGANNYIVIEELLDPTFADSPNVTCREPSQRTTIGQADFCLGLAHYFTNTTSEYIPTLYYCSASPNKLRIHTAYPVLLFISALALIAIFLIYLLAPAQAMARIIVNPRARHRSAVRLRSQVRLAETLFGKILLCHIISLAFAFTALGLAQLQVTLPGDNFCVATALLVYLGFLSSFSWLTIICFDLWWQFRTPIRLPDEFRFIPYSILGWGGPLIATVVVWAAQMNPEWIACAFQPHLGLQRCWFHGDTALWAFFYGPISTLLALNVIFFVLLCYNLKVFHCFHKPNEHNTQDPLGQRNIYLATELFLIMGLPWILEVLAWLPSLRDRTRWYVYLWEITNIINLSRGFVLFLIFIVLKPKIRRYLWSQCKANRKVPTRKNLSIKPEIATISKGNELAQVTWHNGLESPFDLSPASSSHPGRLKQRHVSELSNFSMASINTNVSTICTTPMNEPNDEAVWSPWNHQDISEVLPEAVENAIPEIAAEVTYL